MALSAALTAISTRQQTVARIVAAARECFAENGVEATRMDHIARRADLSRAYLYRFVSGRDELVELAILARLNELGIELADQADQHNGNLADALLDRITAGLRSGRDDPEFRNLAEGMHRTRLNWILTATDSPVHRITARMFGDLYTRAGAEGALIDGIEAEVLYDWLQGVMALFASRDDLDDTQIRNQLRTFVLPSIIRTP